MRRPLLLRENRSISPRNRRGWWSSTCWCCVLACSNELSHSSEASIADRSEALLQERCGGALHRQGSFLSTYRRKLPNPSITDAEARQGGVIVHGTLQHTLRRYPGQDIYYSCHMWAQHSRYLCEITAEDNDGCPSYPCDAASDANFSNKKSVGKIVGTARIGLLEDFPRLSRVKQTDQNILHLKFLQIRHNKECRACC